jgi:hypothetical protein
MKRIVRTVATAALATLCVTGCSERRPDVKFLASDLQFKVGDEHIVVPAVALRGPDHAFDLSGRKPERSLKETLKSEAGDPKNPMKMDKLDLIVREYQFTGEWAASIAICPLLKRNWSRALCLGQHRGLLRRLPQKFDLLVIQSVAPSLGVELAARPDNVPSSSPTVSTLLRWYVPPPARIQKISDLSQGMAKPQGVHLCLIVHRTVQDCSPAHSWREVQKRGAR